MIFRQLTHDDLGCASYVIGDEDAGVAAVVDPKLQRYGGEQVIHIVEGGVPLWKRQGWPTEQPLKA